WLEIHAAYAGMPVADSRLDVRHATSAVGSTQPRVELESEHDDDLFRTDVNGRRARPGPHPGFLARLVVNRGGELGLRPLTDEQPVRFDEEHDGHGADH